MKCETIHVNRTLFSVARMCKVLGVSEAVYYEWIRSEQRRAERRARDRGLIDAVTRIFRESRETYGCRKVRAALAEEGVIVSEYKVRKVMRENGLYPILQKKWKPYRKGKSDGMFSENVVQRKFNPEGMNCVWVGDITYIATSLGWVYLAAVIDLYNREVVGYQLGRNIDAELAMNAMGNALALRGPHEGLVFHSDRGVQYSSKKYRKLLEDNGVTASMSAPGCPYDNSCMESFFASLKKELIYRKKYSTMEEVETDIFEYIEMFYNRKRLHSTLGYVSPVTYRLRHQAA